MAHVKKGAVQLSHDNSHGRRRFTLAHELAHVILAAEGSKSTSRALERQCDALAGALLMPARAVRELVKTGTPAEILKLSASCETSVHAAAVRVAELLGVAVLTYASASGQIRPLAGKFKGDEEPVRRAIQEHATNAQATIVQVSDGRRDQHWTVTFGTLTDGRILCVFRRRD